ncbi:MAG: KGGVGR-motif variant AAA ATPase [Pyrinomonadaceae bacterium]
MNSDSRGQIITFYSYKGGTGRSMALANIACILAERQSISGGKGVLMIDWDLEAPGLHRYFHNRLAVNRLTLGRSDASHDEKPGLIDLFYEFNDKTDYHISQGSTLSDTSNQTLSKEQLAHEAIAAVDLKQYVLPTTLSGLDLLKSGKFSRQNPNEYSERVNKFNWEALYTKTPHLIRVFAETLAKDYAYVLIDSRTGVTDISGICTMLLPEKLVVVFTPNLQSLKGGLDLIRRATDYRKESADLRPLVVFPLVSRVEMSEPELRHDWRFGNKETNGYQPEFERALAEVYGKENITLDQYFDQLQIQHIPKYAYGEEIAVLSEKTWDKFSLRRSYRTFADKLIESHSPWEGEIKEDVSSGMGDSGLAPILTSVVDLFSLSSASRALRATIVVILLLFGVVALAFSYSQSSRAEAALTSLDDAQKVGADSDKKNAVLQLEIEELRKQSNLDQIKTIKDLNNQLSNATLELNQAKQDKLVAENQVAAAVRDKTQAQSDVSAAKKETAKIQSDFTAAKTSWSKGMSEHAKRISSLENDLERCRKSRSAFRQEVPGE